MHATLAMNLWWLSAGPVTDLEAAAAMVAVVVEA